MNQHQPPATLVLSPDDPANTTLYDAANAGVIYTVSTQLRWNIKTTYVIDVHGAVVSALQERYLLSDRVILGKRPPMALHEWLHINMAGISINMNASFKDELGRKYKWKGNAARHGDTLELFAKEDEYAEPIARFDRSRPWDDSRPPNTEQQRALRPATLRLTLRALEIRNTVVVSLLILEKKRRKDNQLMVASLEDPAELVVKWGL